MVLGGLSKCEHPHNLIKWCPQVNFCIQLPVRIRRWKLPTPEVRRHSAFPRAAPRDTCLSGWRGRRSLRRHHRGLQTPSGAHCGSNSPRHLRVPLGQALGDGPQNAFSVESTQRPVVVNSAVLPRTEQSFVMYLFYPWQVLKLEANDINIANHAEDANIRKSSHKSLPFVGKCKSTTQMLKVLSMQYTPQSRTPR